MAKVQNDFYFRWAQSRIQATYTTNQTLTSLIEYVGVDTTTGEVQITLPDTSGNDVLNGKKIYIIDQGNAGTNYINVIPNSLDSTTINNGLIRHRITENYGILIFELVNNSWEIVNRYNQNSIITLTSASILTEIDNVIIGDPAGGAFTTTLPTAVGRKGKTVVLKKGASANQWVVNGSGGQTIDGMVNLIFTGINRPSAVLISDGANWLIIGGA